MSRIYDALKKLEAERHGAHGGGNGGAGGNGKGNGSRRGWKWLFPGGRAQRAKRVGVSFELGPEAEEAYQRLGTNLLLSPGTEQSEPLRLLGLTAGGHGEGTTTTAGVFASVLVRRRGCRVAVVEANLRSPSFDTMFGIRRDGGFSDVIEGRRSVPEVAQQTEIANLFAIGAGQTGLGPAALFDSAGIVNALTQLREQFDFVLFDLPPANLYGDTSILGPRLDAALIVIEADHTRIPEVERMRRSLERVGVKLAGSILNRRRNYIPPFLEELL
jgi:capsular exopolysaccharide synthesis family protein